VLPVINNLLENREMALEDGRFIVSASRYAELKARHGEDVVHSWHLIPAHPDFFVIAIGLPVPPYFGNPLDPPLRSRFQARTEGMPRVGSQLLRVRRVAPGVNSAVLGRVVVSMQCGGFDVGVGRCMLRNGVLVDLVSFFFNTIPLLYTHCYIPYCYTPIVTCHCHHTIVTHHCHTPLFRTIVTHHCQTTIAKQPWPNTISTCCTKTVDCSCHPRTAPGQRTKDRHARFPPFQVTGKRTGT
jgi:hypothetical protein